MRIFNYRIILYIFVVASFWIIASVELEVAPLIPTFFSIELVEKINRVLSSIAFSFLAAYIFYVITTVLPRKMLIYRSKKILAQQVYTLLYEMFVMISQILYVFDIKKEILDIKEKDLFRINGDTTKKHEGFYGTQEYWNRWTKKRKKIPGLGSMEFKYPENIYKALSKIPKSIEKIRASNPNFYIDEEFAEILSSIETSKVIELYSDKKNPLFLFANSSKHLYNFILDYKRLLKKGYGKVYRNSYHKIHIYTPEENAMVPIRRKELLSIGAPRLRKIISLSPCIVYNDLSDNAKNIISQMNRGNILLGHTIRKQYLLFQTRDKINVDKNRCIVILDDLLPKNEVKKFINTNAEKVIILIKPSILYATKSGSFKKKVITNGVYIIYYRTDFSLLRFKFNAKYPTTQMMQAIESNVNDIMENYTED